MFLFDVSTPVSSRDKLPITTPDHTMLVNSTTSSLSGLYRDMRPNNRGSIIFLLLFYKSSSSKSFIIKSTDFHDFRLLNKPALFLNELFFRAFIIFILGDLQYSKITTFNHPRVKEGRRLNKSQTIVELVWI